jgi:7-keto-8-aminopelargonate synthetase-like enzyme
MDANDQELIEITSKNSFRNNKKMVDIGTSFWNDSEGYGLAGILANLKENKLYTEEGHQFVNFSCCSYLDLDQHPKIIQGAIDSLKRFGVLDHCITRARVQLPALCELESSLSELFKAKIVTSISASVATQGLLPLMASGHLAANGHRPLMVFDKNCHVSMYDIKPVCADETEIVTCNHHDLNFLEDALKKYKSVCYVCDGSDSLGGYAPVEEIQLLQQRYGLNVYYDDCHSLSAIGEKGRGYVRSKYDELDEKTIIVATLNKAFGASGAAIMLGNNSSKVARIIERFAGAIGYSQPMNTAAIGACLASAEIHRTSELTDLQQKLQKNIALFDSLITTPQKGSTYPIRLVKVDDTKVVDLAQKIYNSGYYVSPVFFPVIARGTAGLRVMMRVGQSEKEIIGLTDIIKSIN